MYARLCNIVYYIYILIAILLGIQIYPSINI